MDYPMIGGSYTKHKGESRRHVQHGCAACVLGPAKTTNTLLESLSEDEHTLPIPILTRHFINSLERLYLLEESRLPP